MTGHGRHTRPDPTRDLMTDWGGGLGGSMPAGGVSEVRFFFVRHRNRWVSFSSSDVVTLPRRLSLGLAEPLLS